MPQNPFDSTLHINPGASYRNYGRWHTVLEYDEATGTAVLCNQSRFTFKAHGVSLRENTRYGLELRWKYTSGGRYAHGRR